LKQLLSVNIYIEFSKIQLVLPVNIIINYVLKMLRILVRF
jgi:hypothetical protein